MRVTGASPVDAARRGEAGAEEKGEGANEGARPKAVVEEKDESGTRCESDGGI